MVTCCLEKPISRYTRMKWAVTGAPRECWEEVPRIPRNQVRVTQKKCSKRNKEIIVTISILEGTYIPGKAHRPRNLRHSFCHKIMRTQNSCGLCPVKDWECGSKSSEKRRGWESGSDSVRKILVLQAWESVLDSQNLYEKLGVVACICNLRVGKVDLRGHGPASPAELVNSRPMEGLSQGRLIASLRKMPETIFTLNKHPCTCTHTSMYAHIHTHTHTCIHTDVHASTCIRKQDRRWGAMGIEQSGSKNAFTNKTKFISVLLQQHHLPRQNRFQF